MNAITIIAPTPWVERIAGRVESRVIAGQLEIQPGYVVRLYDRMAKDPDAPFFDSERTHGDLGVFGSETEAEDFRDRIREATVAARQQAEHEREIRAPKAVELGCAEQAKRDAARAEASAATKRAKGHQEAIDRLQQEAKDPEILVECTPRGKGWRVMAAPAQIDGTLGGAPRLLQRAPKRTKPERPTSAILDDALEAYVGGASAEAVVDAVKSKPKGRKRAQPAAEDLPPVQDAGGQELRVGSEVELPGLEPVTKGKVTEIGDYDPKAGSWIVLVESEDGEILRPLASECLRIEPEEQPAEHWPDGPEAA